MSEDSAKCEFNPDGATLPAGSSPSGGVARPVKPRPRLERAEHLSAAEARLAAGEPRRHWRACQPRWRPHWPHPGGVAVAVPPGDGLAPGHHAARSGRGATGV